MDEDVDVQWEYRCLRPPTGETGKEATDPTDALDDLGADGWELTETVDYEGGGTKFLVLKRRASTAPRHNGDDTNE